MIDQETPDEGEPRKKMTLGRAVFIIVFVIVGLGLWGQFEKSHQELLNYILAVYIVFVLPMWIGIRLGR